MPTGDLTPYLGEALDEAGELRELARDHGRLAVLIRARAVVCAAEARDHLRLACWLALNTALPVDQCLTLLRFAGNRADPPARYVALRSALARDLDEAADFLGFRDAAPVS